ncbi:Ni,Fe-hydrogenase III large subunit [Rothia sp. HMSC062F03]|uniref:sterol carrier family protein n=1 Tax=Rothia sp. HMSC062F03 TaxID=1715153 RepID=UPI0008A91CAC|nr:sterol carrier family protein [Rothia sp. HMSC062F03]OHP74258.1 Ni,Fe-hydrogenase III large subunit [Rothia sp. HMSC062F03]
MAIRRKTSEADGMAAVREVRAFFEERRAAAGEPADSHARGEYLLNSPEVEQAFAALPRPVRATFVRFTLEELATLAPGNSVEVRVPPLGVTQCVAGPRHTRGTPPSVVETSPAVWAALVLGACSWAQAVSAGALDASGERSDLSGLLPLF